MFQFVILIFDVYYIKVQVRERLQKEIRLRAEQVSQRQLEDSNFEQEKQNRLNQLQQQENADNEQAEQEGQLLSASNIVQVGIPGAPVQEKASQEQNEAATEEIEKFRQAIQAARDATTEAENTHVGVELVQQEAGNNLIVAQHDFDAVLEISNTKKAEVDTATQVKNRAETTLQKYIIQEGDFNIYAEYIY